MNILLLVFLVAAFVGIGGGSVAGTSDANVPANIGEVFNLPRYQKVLWGLRVVDVSNGKVLIDLQPDHGFPIGSVR